MGVCPRASCPHASADGRLPFSCVSFARLSSSRHKEGAGRAQRPLCPLCALLAAKKRSLGQIRRLLVTHVLFGLLSEFWGQAPHSVGSVPTFGGVCPQGCWPKMTERRSFWSDMCKMRIICGKFSSARVTPWGSVPAPRVPAPRRPGGCHSRALHLLGFQVPATRRAQGGRRGLCAPFAPSLRLKDEVLGRSGDSL